MITKQRVIMHRALTSPFPTFMEDLDDSGTQRRINLAYGAYCDMGRPAVITVTIEPGDLLNDDAS